MYKKIKTKKDLVDLQSDINYLVNWSMLNAVDLNIGKCHIISFYKSKSKIIDQHVHKISDIQISRAKLIKDLWRIFRLQPKVLGSNRLHLF